MSASGSSPGPLERGREAYERHDWAVAYASLAAAEEAAPLAIEDLDRLAWSAELSGDSEGFLKATERVYELRLAEGALRPAARAAFWVGFRAMSLGEAGRANAWLGRAQRLVEGESTECAEQGYLLLPVAFRHQLAGQLEASVAVAGAAAAIGDRFGERRSLRVRPHHPGTGAGSSGADRARAWRCSTRACWPPPPTGCRRSSPASSTAA